MFTGALMGQGGSMHVPRFIILSFLGLLLAGTLLGTALLASTTEPELGDSIVVTPLSVPGTAPQSTSTAVPSPKPQNTNSPPTSGQAPASVEPGAVPVPACVIAVGSDDCVDEVDGADDSDDGDDDDGVVGNE